MIGTLQRCGTASRCGDAALFRSREIRVRYFFLPNFPISSPFASTWPLIALIKVWRL